MYYRDLSDAYGCFDIHLKERCSIGTYETYLALEDNQMANEQWRTMLDEFCGGIEPPEPGQFCFLILVANPCSVREPGVIQQFCFHEVAGDCSQKFAAH